MTYSSKTPERERLEAYALKHSFLTYDGKGNEHSVLSVESAAYVMASEARRVNKRYAALRAAATALCHEDAHDSDCTMPRWKAVVAALEGLK